jgi:hypothetical protein
MDLPDPLYISKHEAKKILGVSYATIQRNIKQKYIPVRKIGNQTVILKEYIDNLKKKPNKFWDFERGYNEIVSSQQMILFDFQE